MRIFSLKIVFFSLHSATNTNQTKNVSNIPRLRNPNHPSFQYPFSDEIALTTNVISTRETSAHLMGGAGVRISDLRDDRFALEKAKMRRERTSGETRGTERPSNRSTKKLIDFILKIHL